MSEDKTSDTDIDPKLMESDASRAAKAEMDDFETIVDNTNISETEKTPEQIEADRINHESEAKAVQEMVDMGLLMPEEAINFNFDQEIEIPGRITDGPAHVSERLQKWIISKLPPEKFNIDNLRGTYIHGTWPRAIPEIWQATGEIKTAYNHPVNGQNRQMNPTVFVKKGVFSFHGEGAEIRGNDGLDHGHSAKFPILITNRKDHPRHIFFITEPGAVILNPKKSLDESIEETKNQLGSFERKNLGDYEWYLIVNRAKVDFSDSNKKHEIIAKMKEYPGIFKVLNKYNLDEITVEDYARFLISEVITDEEFKEMLSSHTQQLEKMKKSSLEKKYNWGSEEKQLYLTEGQMVNYLSNAMAKGVDKSKLVPIYNRDGKLLWPLVEEDQETE